MVSAAEPDLGLGIVAAVEGRQVTLVFPVAQERRVYAMDSAPLTRIRYAAGDRVRDVRERELRVDGVEERDTLLIYLCTDEHGEAVRLPEIDLSADVQITTPLQRLTNGQIDPGAVFALRRRTVARLDALQRSPLRGLRGGRISLLEHQLHIAHEVARRDAPRVLLADEVGLGKTIEAGMIVHHQLLTGRARRVLILVPDSLLHQWLVEMLRRFNLRFALFDTERWDALRDSGEDNPFETEQQVLAPLSLFAGDPALLAAALDADWDLVIVDEAHNLKWPGDEGIAPGTDPAVDAYRAVEALGARSAGLLLLTATPEQLGVASHFARLRLLDPARFHDLDAYRAEEQTWQAVSAAVAPLLDDDAALDEAHRATLGKLLDEPIPAEPDSDTRARWVRELLDRHGTGRVFFRNTRAAVADFPERRVHVHPLTAPPGYLTPPSSLHEALYPESAHDPARWCAEDPRVAWLAQTLRALRHEKVLVICHRKETAKALDAHLTLREGLRTTSFYEGLSLLERDRAAAYFAEGRDDEGGGAQALVCSEIGSEGRNFQFAHHLVLFDLPLHPDLLEQRIGRLDRIGQTQTIHLHVPHLRDSAQARLLAWHRDGLGMLEQPFYAGHGVYAAFVERLEGLLLDPAPAAASVDALIADTAAAAARARTALAAGRDRLIELNSCDPRHARDLIDALESEDRDPALADYLEAAFDHYGVEHDFHSEHAIVLRAGERTQLPLPGVGDEGLTATFRREKALAREDMHYLTWEHPLVLEVLSATHLSEVGNATLATLSLPSLPAGTLLLEALYTVAVVAPASLQLERFVSLHPERVLMAAGGHDVSAQLDSERLDGLCQDVDAQTARAVLAQVRPQLAALAASADAKVAPRLAKLQQRAAERVRTELGAERDRLVALARVNPSVRDEEIARATTRVEAALARIERAALRLDALRLIVAA